MGHGASVDITNISPEDAKRLMIELETTVKRSDEEKSSSGHHHGTETSTRSKRVRQQKNIFSEVCSQCNYSTLFYTYFFPLFRLQIIKKVIYKLLEVNS